MFKINSIFELAFKQTRDEELQTINTLDTFNKLL